ncbi:protein-glutamate O-methyltransferase CheR [Maritimibacter sp. DP1N21-5]|uniref:CheR family methyltransferase n=1 Tax=Maritimibacter sp. DP1N21-5 TaxID=2836867 RepID=UPI001C45D06D|nr:CheR family methyltransferase [Maritimibacter sp. DP1N21-5]MBV7409867.1 hypothetical protein [Maritimibacter sp. DP1N21-5]
MTHSLANVALSPDAFRVIARLAHDEAGLAIPETKSAMVRTRIARRLRALHLSSFEDYLDLIQSDAGHAEITMMISALTTNVSSFFRERHHFDTLVAWLANRGSAWTAQSPVRIWSAGCALGQEPFSIAMSILKHFPDKASCTRILATDIDREALRFAQAAIYPTHMCEGLAAEDRHQFLSQVPSGHRVTQDLRDMVHFRTLNLLESWPMRARYDAIFCRNVVIYFDQPTKEDLWHRFRTLMTPESRLFVGHSERLPETEEAHFEKVGVTCYRPRPNTP